MNELKLEIQRLISELDEANAEKIQSAQYGIALLEEKTKLEERCEDLEAVCENIKHELHLTRDVSYHFCIFGKPGICSRLEEHRSLALP